MVIVYFLGGLGALLGPLFGIVMADYWLLRKRRINVPELYTTDPGGTYFYSRGINLRAIGALIPAAGDLAGVRLRPGPERLLGVLLVHRGRSGRGDLLRPG